MGMSACNTNASSNYMGSTVLLDVNSNTPGAPPVASALDCCLACMGNAQVPILDRERSQTYSTLGQYWRWHRWR